ncbi:MAG: hypothetical protein HC913_22240 [Microscillaceae bacterium]|nr:hypothetical protein [Microscillaceae bacterium]
MRDVAVAHCREDLLGKCPSLHEWLAEAGELQDYEWQIPRLADEALNRFIWQPFLRTGHRGAFIITATDFGVFLVERFFGWEAARQLAEALPAHQKVALLLHKFTICARWQHKPDPQALQWLADYEKKF